MTKNNQSEDIHAHNQGILEDLAWAIEADAEERDFSLKIVRCNYPILRDRFAKQLQEICTIPISELRLESSDKTLYTKIKKEIQAEQTKALMVFGFDSVKDIGKLLRATNQVREEFCKNFAFPVLLWVNDTILRELSRFAADFKNWSPPSFQFLLSRDALIEDIREKADTLFARLLELGAEKFIPNQELLGANYRLQARAAVDELEGYDQKLPADIQASLDFFGGRNSYGNGDIKQALEAYQKSLSFFKQQNITSSSNDSSKIQSSSTETENLASSPTNINNITPSSTETENLASSPTNINNIPPSSTEIENLASSPTNINNIPPFLRGDLKTAVLLFHIGLCYCRLAEQENPSNWEQAKDNLQQCLDIFAQAEREDLVANFMNSLGEVLQNLKGWEDLDKLAKKSLKLHQTYPNLALLAQDYAFLAQVALKQSRYQNALKVAQLAINTISEFSVSEQQNKGIYFLILAQAQEQLAQHSEAVKSQEEAANSGAGKQPLVYLGLLEELRQLYFKNKHYLEAYNSKQEQLSIRQQYGLIAFVGASRIKSAKTAQRGTEEDSFAQEIAASGRQYDVENLMYRIATPKYKLTIIYGESGVGKSSILEAGLLPALINKKSINNRDVVPIKLRFYNNWEKELGQLLRESLQQIPNVNLVEDDNYSKEIIIKQLQSLPENPDLPLLIVLIFDQFEEFFFVCEKEEERKHFFDFLGQCLETRFVKVVLSLRDDYLHLLLKGTRRLDLHNINNNILDKNILYYLGNLSEKATKKVIESLTARSRFSLATDLIEQLVEDLAGELGEVRPIELQVVGAQMQTEGITTLDKYQECGTKENLVQRYLDEVVNDCGEENQKLAQFVLYLLTDENNTRPLKTKLELEKELEPLAKDLTATESNLDLVLEIVVKSGLVFLLPETPADRYQLVHDYLVSVIRQQQGESLLTRLKEAEAAREREKAGRIKWLKIAMAALFVGFLGMTGLSVVAVIFALESRKQAAMAFVNQLAVKAQWIRSRRADLHLSTILMAVESIKGFQDLEESSVEANEALREGLTLLPTLVSEINHDGDVWEVEFSRDGKYLATGSRDNTARIVEVETGKEIKTINHDGVVTQVEFSRDGKYLATGSRDNTARIVEVETGKEIGRINHQEAVKLVEFSPDKNDKYLVTLSGSTVAFHWLLPQQLIDEACLRRVNRNLTADEWLRYMGDKPLSEYNLTCDNLPIHPTVLRVARDKVKDKEIEEAKAIFRRVQKLNPDIDLNPATEKIDTDISKVIRYFQAE
ncbi:MAG: ATP-binding protein [Moorea sp. SIO2B7]|nr:ATP-binding protein [Moorena sp. SIO2B7]